MAVERGRRPKSVSSVGILAGERPAQACDRAGGEFADHVRGGFDPGHGADRLARVERHRVHLPGRGPGRAERTGRRDRHGGTGQHAFGALPLPVEPELVGNILFSTLLLITGTLTIGRRSTALTTAATLGVLQLLLWWFSPWAARVYADASGLPLRDNLGDIPPELPSEIPVFMLFAAAAITALLWLSRSRGWSGRIAPQIMGAGGGAVTGLSLPVQSALFGDSGPAPSDLLTMTAVGLATGVIAGYLAARLAVLLREHSTASITKGR
ncbi:hypothetical protein [Streptomyces sp. 11-1-2]|uniref:hypothetical protein n=1 Tax=unclassified Streptomyces TaxID=2593676 RepID=UPI000B8DA6F6|nr:hypothetical protein [Streptomyces sp. 11-1-2]ASQ93012.1 hypothetical protein CGL27_07430 [Streptomyces sp. 11-1-2]